MFMVESTSVGYRGIVNTEKFECHRMMQIILCHNVTTVMRWAIVLGHINLTMATAKILSIA
jgi:hypothetical protein